MKTNIEQVILHSGVPGDAEFQQLDVKSMCDDRKDKKNVLLNKKC